MGLKVSRCLPLFVLLLVLFASQLAVNAQSVPCAAITRNPLVLEALLDSHSNDSEPDLDDGTINAAQLEHLQLGPIVIEPGDALYIEYRGKDFIVNADFASGDRTAFDSSPKGSYEQWRKGILPLDMFRPALNQRLVRLRVTAKSPNQVFFRNVKIIRAGKPVFEFANLASYGKSQVKTAVQRQLPCVGFDEAPGSGSATAASYSLPNPGPLRNFSGGLAQPMLPPFSMMMMQSTTTSPDANHYKFTGKELDDETGLYNYGARYYGPALGRFITPDWSAVPVPVPYADLTNPQTLNQYSYVGGNPASKADPDGHEAGYTYNRDGTMTAPVNAQTDGHPIRDTLLLGAATVTALAAPGAGPLVQGLIGLAGVTAPTTVPIAQDIIEGATPGAPGPKLPAASTLSKAEQLVVNNATGKAFEQSVKPVLESKQAGVVEQLTVKTETGVKTRVDFAGTESGKTVLTEAKSSATAPLTPNQTKAFPEIQQTGCTVCGNGKPGYPGGTKIPPTKVNVVRPDSQ